MGFVIKSVTPVFNKLCSEEAKSLATIITNDETTKAIIDYKYSDFIIIHKNSNGNILMLEYNMKNINMAINAPKTIHKVRFVFSDQSLNLLKSNPFSIL